MLNPDTKWKKKRVLGAFAKLRRGIITIVKSVRPFAWNNSAPTGRIFMKSDIRGFYKKKFVQKIQFALRSEKDNRYFT
jgi:hypothetical protein